jgi:spermidine/putrescine-binding protein
MIQHHRKESHMNGFKTFASGLAAVVLAGSMSTAALAAESLVFTSWGGTTQDAQKKAWAEPFTKATGIKVNQDGPTDYGKFKAMVESGNVAWDVVDVEYDFAVKAAADGLLEPIDFAVVDKKAIDPRFVTDHAVGSFYYSFVIGYNKDTYGTKAPKTWADVFDTKAFPGKRTFYKWSAPGVLEIALLADGVPADKLYPLDIDRAFKKLDTIKKDIVWWGGGAQSQQLLASGEAPIGEFWNLVGAEPDRRRRPRRAQGLEEQGDRDEVPRRRHRRQGPGRRRHRDRLCADQRQVEGADGQGRGRRSAGRPHGRSDQPRHDLLGGPPRRDRQALVRLAGAVSPAR